jgi:hypothetical protein
MSKMLSDEEVQRALRHWEEYQKQHDVSDRMGQAVGIDPVSGRIWFGTSVFDIQDQLDAEGSTAVPIVLRVGRGYYIRKG